MLLIFGSINVDFFFPVPFLPQAGDTVWSAPGHVSPGGKGANQAVAAARDGASVTLAGAVGQDVLAQGVLAGLRAAHIQLRVMRIPDAATGHAAICVTPDGHSTVTADSGANARACADQVADAQLGPNTTLLLQMETDPEQNASLILRARCRDTRIILNLAPSRMIATEALRAVDLLIGNSQEISWLGRHLGTAGNPASIHAALSIPTVRTLGPQGADLVSNDGFVHMPAYPVAMRDTTSAADCFVGVFAAAWGRGAELAVSLRRAAVAAALSITQTGAQISMPYKDDIDSALRDAPVPSSIQQEVPD